MEKMVLQFIAAAFALFALSRVYLRFREKKLSSFSFIFWTLVWLAGVMAIIFPNITGEVAKFLGIGRGVDAVLYASILVLFYLIFRIYIKVEDTQKEITTLSRKIALLDIKNQKISAPRKRQLASSK